MARIGVVGFGRRLQHMVKVTARHDPDLNVVAIVDPAIDALRAEFPGILSWALQGCRDWQQHGLPMPDKVAAATADYRSEMDALSGGQRIWWGLRLKDSSPDGGGSQP